MRGISWLAAKFTVSFSRRTLLHGVSKYIHTCIYVAICPPLWRTFSIKRWRNVFHGLCRRKLIGGNDACWNHSQRYDLWNGRSRLVVQYIVQYNVQYNVQYIVRYIVQYIVQYILPLKCEITYCIKYVLIWCVTENGLVENIRTGYLIFSQVTANNNTTIRTAILKVHNERKSRLNLDIFNVCKYVHHHTIQKNHQLDATSGPNTTNSTAINTIRR
jgi:hypothetical protein